MSEGNTTENMAGSAFKGTKPFGWMGTKDLPLEALLASHRKNMEAIRQAQQAASDLVRDVSQLNTQYMNSSLDNLCRHARNMQVGAQKVMSADPAISAIKEVFESSMGHYKKVSEVFSTSTSKIFSTYKKRFDEGQQEAKSFTQKKS